MQKQKYKQKQSQLSSVLLLSIALLLALMIVSCSSLQTGMKLSDRPASLMAQPQAPDISLPEKATLKDVLLSIAIEKQYCDTIATRHFKLGQWVDSLYQVTNK